MHMAGTDVNVSPRKKKRAKEIKKTAKRQVEKSTNSVDEEVIIRICKNIEGP